MRHPFTAFTHGQTCQNMKTLSNKLWTENQEMKTRLLVLTAFGIFLSLIIFIAFIYSIHGAWEEGSLDHDPDLSSSHAYNSFGLLSFNSIFVAGPILLGVISLVFLVPNIILRLKNIPTRKYMLLIGAGVLLFFGSSSILNSTESLLAVDNLKDESNLISLIGGLTAISYGMVFIIPAIILLRRVKLRVRK